MIYHADSSICRAAIHTGAINNPGGVIEIAIKWKIEKFYASENKGIFSMELNQPSSKTFVVGKPNTIAIQLAIDFEERKKISASKSSFIQLP